MAQGWLSGKSSGESTHLPPMWPGFDPGPGVICGLSLFLVLVLAPRVFLRVLRFSSLHKTEVVYSIPDFKTAMWIHWISWSRVGNTKE